MSSIFAFQYKSIESYNKRKLKIDAARLAIKYQNGTKDLKEQSIEISNNYIDEFYKMLVLLNESELEEMQEVKAESIRAASNIAIDKIWLIHIKEADWKNAIETLDIHNGGKVVELIENYDLEVIDDNYWDENNNVLLLQSRNMYNMKALAHQFEQAAPETIEQALPNISDIQPDSDISVKKSNNNWQVTFYKYGSSFINKSKKSWTFEIIDGTKVKFLSKEEA